MKINNFFKSLEKYITYLEIVVYILVFLLMIRSISIIVYDFFTINNIEELYHKTKTNFSFTIFISLSTILFVEILKLFYVKTTHQIIIISGIVILKLIINYFVQLDLSIEDKSK